VYYFYIRCPEQLHELFTVKSSDCSILFSRLQTSSIRCF